ncbi:MAG: GIY-YIG nuclease family protein [Bacteroidetes bacterium]|nr:GIY-YIG nuclease family protein [Bacteroidota bacterium]
MAFVYILNSKSLDKYYIGSCEDLNLRLEQHFSGFFDKAYTSTAKDWIVYFVIENLGYKQARNIEMHIKKMKSKKYIESLKKYPELQQELIMKYK